MKPKKQKVKREVSRKGAKAQRLCLAELFRKPNKDIQVKECDATM